MEHTPARLERRPSQARAGRRGSYLTILALLFVMLCGFAALSIDGNYAIGIREEAQMAAQAAAHAAAFEYQAGRLDTVAQALGQAVLQANEIGGEPVDPSMATITQVGCDWTDPANVVCDVGLNPKSGYRVNITSLQAGGRGRPLFFAPLLQVEQLEPSKELRSIYAVRPANVIVVQDVSKGVYPGALPPQPLDYMRDAIRAYLQSVWRTPQDRLGLLTVTNEVANAGNLIGGAWIPLTTLYGPTPVLTIDTRLTTLNRCSRAGIQACNVKLFGSDATDAGVNLAKGIARAVELLRAADPLTEQSILVVTNRPSFDPISGKTTEWRDAAVTAANTADAYGISVTVLYLGTSLGDMAILDDLVRGRGEFHQVSLGPNLSTRAGLIARLTPVARVF